MALKSLLAPLRTIIPVGGQREHSKVLKGMRTWAVRMTARAEVDVSVGAATALRNRGSVWALFDEVGIEQNGDENVLLDGRMLRFMSEFFAPSALSAVRG